MIIQIYEITNPTEARAIADLGVDHIGVLVGKGNFPRELNFVQTRGIFDSLAGQSKGIALSLAPVAEEIIEVVENTHPDILHIGAPPDMILPDDIMTLKSCFPELPIVRSIPIVGKESLDLAKSYEDVADWLLLDTYQEGDQQIGAVGKIHDWQISKLIAASVKTPVILAGGLGPDNVLEAINIVRPAGVDSKTKTDRADGRSKDLEKVRKFVEVVRSVA